MIKAIPDQTIITIHKKYAPNDTVYNNVFTHCQIVAEIALRIIQTKKLEVDIELVREGALLHDIGAYKLISSEGIYDEDNYIRHGIYGAEILKNEQLPHEICRIAERHTGVGITTEDILNQHLPLPLINYNAETPEEELVMYADKFHSKTPRFNAFESYKKYISRFGEQKVRSFEQLAEKYGIPELQDLAAKYAMSYI